jgi:signal transduction histidine kinase
VFWNITKNAIKFTLEGGAIAIRMRNYKAVDDNAMPLEKEKKNDSGNAAVKRRRPGRLRKQWLMLTIKIMDTGIGIKDHILPHLFCAFQQGDTSITPCDNARRLVIPLA